MVIGIVVVGAVFVSYVSSGKAGRYQEAYAQMNEDAQIGLSMLSREIQMAGYSEPTGLISDGAPTPNYNFVFTTLGVNNFVSGCDTGYTDPEAATLACNSTGATPAFEVVYEGNKDNTVMTTTTPKPSDCLGNALAGAGPYVVRNRYYISATSSTRPELYCASTVSSGGQPLVENVENMKIWYGVANAAGSTQVVRYVTQTDIAALGAGAAAEWSKVIAMRICLLVRSAEPVLNTGEDSMTYLDCDNSAQTTTDRYLRRAYFTTATLRARMPT